MGAQQTKAPEPLQQGNPAEKLLFYVHSPSSSNSAVELSGMCLSQASSGWLLNARSQPSDPRPPAHGAQGSGRSGEPSPGFAYRTLSTYKQLQAAAPWEPLPGWVIKCIFYLVNRFPLTSTSAWPAASTSFLLLNTLWQSLRLQASFSRPSFALSMPSGQQAVCITYNPLPRAKSPSHTSVQPSEAQLLPKDRGREEP